MIRTIISFLCFIPIFLSAQWTLKYDIKGLTQCFDAYDENVAIAAQFRDVHFTFDGGTTWHTKSLAAYFPDNKGGVTDISIKAKSVWVCTGDGRIIKGSIEDTTQWSLQYEHLKKMFCNFIKMFDLDNGVAMFDGGPEISALILKTTNGGKDWIDANNQNLMGLLAASGGNKLIDFHDMNNGIFSATNMMNVYSQKRLLLKTVDGGKSWQLLNENSSIYFTNILMYNENTAVACGLVYSATTGNKFSLFYSVDGGQNWYQYEQPNSSRTLGSFGFVPGDPQKIWFSYNSDLYFTRDAGKTFSLQLKTDSEWLPKIIFVNDKVGWLLSNNGKIYKITNGNIVGVKEEDSQLHAVFKLEQNFPNPFNPTTTISFSLPQRSNVKFVLLDILGREVMDIASGSYGAGIHSVHLNASNLSTGVYIYKLTADNFQSSKKLVLIK
jgi:photosystem II stability/assembly factor-like uncharacterized protein